MRDARLRQLDRLLKPRAVAVVGASQSPSYVTSIIRNLARDGFPGGIWGVNPRYDQIGDLPCVPSLLDIPEVIDHVVVGVPERLVPQILADCERQEVGAVTIITSGFGETDTAGQAKQAALADFSRRTGIRLVGPNCLGVLSTVGRMNAMPYHFEHLKPGSVAFVLQSGAMGACTVIPCLDRGIGVNYCVTSGNEADLETADYLRYFVDDPDTRVIGCFTEQVRSPAKLIEVAELAAAAHKPIVMLKIGRTEASRRAARAHTGSLVGSHDVFEAVARRHGITLVRTVDELIETMAALHCRKVPRGNGVGAILISGGAVGLFNDLGPECGVPFPPLSAPSAERLAAVLPEFGSLGNPLDTTAMAFYWPGLWDGVVDAVAAEPAFDIVLLARGTPSLMDAKAVQLTGFQRALDAHPDKVFLIASLVGGKVHAQTNPNNPVTDPVAEFDGVPFLTGGAENVLRAVSALTRYGQFQRDRAARRAAGPGARLVPETAAVAARRLVEAAHGRPLTEREGKAVLGLYGIATTTEQLATTAEAAVAAANAIGYPVVLKVEASAITHKTEAGGVRLNLGGDVAVAEAFDAIMAGARAYAPGAEIAGVLVQEQVAGGGHEVILGASRDEQFGPTVLCGLGGVLVEVLKDTALALPPLDATEAGALLDRLRGRALLDGVRGGPAADVAALVDALQRFALLAHDLYDVVDEIDINPLIVRPRGGGVKALDCLIVPRAEAAVAAAT